MWYPYENFNFLIENSTKSYPNVDAHASVVVNDLKATMDFAEGQQHPIIYHHRPVDCREVNDDADDDVAVVLYDPNVMEPENCLHELDLIYPNRIHDST